ncbi:hypothetical protein CBR_g21921 [Chara braunii]|uniref:Integrase catalytic domain-containing protein n=1 Tax=Chara braunii TaxID=69332 RepID=A0A388L1S2_CHABU|nr:hypothetical protein CBR_g21921 [Chara braunii]|eukprot:GBG76172.1 hypothetical protein CBR_g21921 [Chara braunii]
MQVTLIGFTNAVAEAQRRMLAVVGDMFPDKCEPYIDDNPIKGAQEKDETKVRLGIRKFVWDHLQDIKDLLNCFLVYNITASGPKSILAVPEVTILGFRCGAYGRKPDPAKTDKISQWPTPLLTTTKLDVIQAIHDGLAGGHQSSKRTLAKITPLYYWPGMAGMVATYCQICLICQERSSIRVFEPLRPTRVLGPGYVIRLDLLVMPVSTDGYKYILDAKDNLSGFVEAIALKKKTGKGVADWIEDLYLRHPFIRRFIADNGTEFVNQEMLSMLKRLCVPIKLIEPYHPEANAPVERGHQTLKNTIAKLAADDLGSWSRYLKQTVFSENMTAKRTTVCIPAELWYGRVIDFPVEALIPTWNRLDDDPHMTTEELIEARCRQVLRNEEAI